MKIKTIFSALALLALAAGASPVSAQERSDPNRAAQANAAPAFQNWLRGFRAKALAEGVSADVLDRELTGLTYNSRVVAYDRDQPVNRVSEGPILPGYLERRLVPSRIEPGRRLAVSLDPVLTRAEAETGVDGNIILGIWGMETNYGGYTGDFDAVRSLATLAFDGRREELFTRELIAALKMIDSGKARRDQMIGSWAGALGNPQFLPTSYLEHAVDADGDGRPNIWSSETDTVASIANYLKHYGWQAGIPWGVKVRVPAGFDRMAVRETTPATECSRVYAKHSKMLPISEWRAMGIMPVAGSREFDRFPSGDVLASLVEVDGQGTDAYLATVNYRALLGYNCSNYYAVSVGTLGDMVGTSRP